MKKCFNNEKNKSSVILNPERSEWVSRSHVTSVEPVVNAGAKTKPHHALRRSLRALAYGSTLKMTALAILLSFNLSTAFAGCSCDPDGDTLTIKGCTAISSSSCADKKMTANNIIIGAGVTSIGYSAFEGASSLTSITIPDSVTSIGSSAFEGASSLKSITIPDSVTSIGDRAFRGTSSLTSITIPDSVTSIGDKAFDRASSLTSITIPEGVTSIGSLAFMHATGLTSITIPDSVTSIGSLAFDDTGLTNIICKGDEKSCTAIADALEESGYDRDIISYQKEANNGNTGGDDIGDVSGDFNPADCYNKGQVPYNNQCWAEYPFAKKRWTPAEANEWLHDGNDNFVVITFKK